VEGKVDVRKRCGTAREGRGVLCRCIVIVGEESAVVSRGNERERGEQTVRIDERVGESEEGRREVSERSESLQRVV
jgi:hypothetical protein